MKGIYCFLSIVFYQFTFQTNIINILKFLNRSRMTSMKYLFYIPINIKNIL